MTGLCQYFLRRCIEAITKLILRFIKVITFNLTLMFDLSKTILKKVSFDKKLFCKELKKAINWVKPDEKTLLKVWCLANFGNEYQKEIIDIFTVVN